MTYHTNTSRISKSGLDLINRAPAHYYERYLNPAANPQKETPGWSSAPQSIALYWSPKSLANATPLGHALTAELRQAKKSGRRS